MIVVFTPGGADKLESAERILNKEKSYNKIPQPRVNVLKLFTVVSYDFHDKLERLSQVSFSSQV